MIEVKPIKIEAGPCPFCGSKNTKYAQVFGYHCLCEDCGADTMFYGAERNLMATNKKWRRRPENETL